MIEGEINKRSERSPGFTSPMLQSWQSNSSLTLKRTDLFTFRLTWSHQDVTVEVSLDVIGVSSLTHDHGDQTFESQTKHYNINHKPKNEESRSAVPWHFKSCNSRKLMVKILFVLMKWINNFQHLSAFRDTDSMTKPWFKSTSNQPVKSKIYQMKLRLIRYE